MAEKHQPELAIIIVNWNGRDLLPGCLQSILDAPPSVPYEVIVVDNASTDGSVEWLREQQPRFERAGSRLRIIENEENLGFGRANNKALAASDTPYIMLLNSDTVVKPGALDRLLAVLRSEQSAAACGPRLLNRDGSVQPNVWPNPPKPWEIIVDGLRLYHLLPQPMRGELLLGGHWHYKRRCFVPQLFGAAVLVRRKAIEACGGFDPAFEFYGEDVEWCLRMIRSGWRLMFEPSAEIIHLGGASARLRWDVLEKEDMVTRAWIEFNRRALPRLHAGANLTAAVIATMAQLVARRAMRRSTAATERRLLLLWSALRGTIQARR